MPPVAEPSDEPEPPDDSPAQPEISERKTLVIASPSADDDQLLVHAQGHTHVVLVSSYKLDQITEASAEKLTSTEDQPQGDAP